MPTSKPLELLLGSVVAPFSAMAAPSLLDRLAAETYSAVRLERLCTAPRPKRRVVPASAPAALLRTDCAIEAFSSVAPTRYEALNCAPRVSNELPLLERSTRPNSVSAPRR